MYKIEKAIKGMGYILGLSSVLLLSSCSPIIKPEIQSKIRNDMANKLMAVYEHQTGLWRPASLEPGKGYVLAVNTNGLSEVTNKIHFDGRLHYCNKPFDTIVEFRFLHDQEDGTLIAASQLPESIKLWYFSIPDSDEYYENNVIKTTFSYKKSSVNHLMYEYQYFNFRDRTIDQALVKQTNQPLRLVQAKGYHFGDFEDESYIRALHKDFKQSFRYATKGYVSVEVEYVGRKSFPGNNENVGGIVHNYLEWWNSVPHDLEGTDLLPLDPLNPEDRQHIKVAWYTAHGGREQMHKDIKELFGVGVIDHAMITMEAPFRFSLSPGNAFVGIHKEFSFSQMKNGVKQWGLHKDYGHSKFRVIKHLMLHEYGHCFNFVGHALSTYYPSEDEWETRVVNQGLQSVYNIMSSNDSYLFPRNFYYKDNDIRLMLKPVMDINELEKMNRPFVDPLGVPIPADYITLEGKKDSGAAILINNVNSYVADSLEDWKIEHDLKPFKTHLDITQELNGKVSAPTPLYTSIVSVVLFPEGIVLSLQKTGGNEIDRGKAFRIILHAKSKLPLKEIWWWLEKQQADGSFKQVSDEGHLQKVYGSRERKVEYFLAIAEPGNYKVRAQAQAKEGSGDNSILYIPEAAFSIK